VISLHINKIKSIQSSFKSEIEEQRRSALQKLQAINANIFNQAEQTYLNNVIIEFRDTAFLTKTPTEIDAIKQNIGVLPLGSLLDNQNNPAKKQLTHFIQEALNYTHWRNKFYPKYFRKIGIKSCVYCNSQLTIAISKKKNEIDARFEVDHHDPKSDFPYLSISLFNLYPCCSSCNKRKSTTPVNFKLYTDDVSKLTKSDYNFEISKSSKCAYLLSKDVESIKISFNDASTPAAGEQSLQDAFRIEEIHNTQKDIIAELIIKNQIYNESFKNTLQKNFSKLSLSQNDFDRVIVGNYTKVRDIHKRPFSKMTMDIAEQLGLIK
jgi:hypothetical protein